MRLSSYTKKTLLMFLLVLGTALPAAATMSVASRILLEKLQLTISVADSQLPVSAEDKQAAIELWQDADLLATCGDTLLWINQQLFVGGKASDPFEAAIQRCLNCLEENPDGAALLQILPDSVKQWASSDFQKIAETTEFLALEKQFMACKIYLNLPDASVSFFTQKLDQLLQKPNPLISLEFLEIELRKIHWAEADIRDLMLLFGKIKMHQRIYPLSRECFRNADYLQPGPVLPGLDSTFTARSDSLSRTVLTPSGHRLFAESLNMLALDLVDLNNSLRSIQARIETNTATADDSVRIPILMTEAYTVCNTPGNPDFRLLRKAYRKRDDLRLQDMRFMADQVIKFAETYLKMASKSDPFSQVHPISLANSVYMQQAENFADSSKFVPAAAVLEQLTAQQAGNWQLFLLLGNAYLGAKQWDNAIRNYEKARENVEKSAFLLLNANESRAFSADPDSTPANTAFLLNCYWSQAQAEIMANKGVAALISLKEAHKMAVDTLTAENISHLIAAVSWDAGNIPAMNLRTRAVEFQNNNNFPAAKAAYVQLLPILWTQRRRDEINNQVAMLDFVNLGLKDAGIERLRILTSTLTIDANGQPIDSVNTIYFENYGTMSYDYGNRYLENAASQRTAFVYFMQSTKFNWHGRPRAYLNLAQLVAWNPEIAYGFAMSAMEEVDKLATTEVQQLAIFISDICQQKADFDQAIHWYQRSQNPVWCENPQL